MTGRWTALRACTALRVQAAQDRMPRAMPIGSLRKHVNVQTKAASCDKTRNRTKNVLIDKDSIFLISRPTLNVVQVPLLFERHVKAQSSIWLRLPTLYDPSFRHVTRVKKPPENRCFYMIISRAFTFTKVVFYGHDSRRLPMSLYQRCG